MELTDNICNLIADLEYLIGKECYNPNSYDGWNDVEGCSFRYPLSYPNSKGEFAKIRGSVNSKYFQREVTPSAISYMKYKFGSNELFVGLGIKNVLTYLEDRYNLNFDELEGQLKDKESPIHKVPDTYIELF